MHISCCSGRFACDTGTFAIKRITMSCLACSRFTERMKGG